MTDVDTTTGGGAPSTVCDRTAELIAILDALAPGDDDDGEIRRIIEAELFALFSPEADAADGRAEPRPFARADGRRGGRAA